jgi:hypothetical protein
MTTPSTSLPPTQPPAVQSISAANLADGQSIAFDNGNLTVTRQDSMFIIKENNGDQMWLLDSNNKRYVAVRDTDHDGDYDSLVESWGDPHFNTEKNLGDITNAESLARHIKNAPLKTEYDVQTNYSLQDSESVLAMTTKGNDQVVLNDEGTMSYRGADGQWSEFSFKFGADGVSLTDDAKHSVSELSSTGKPLTKLAANPNIGSDDLFVISGTGKWDLLNTGATIGTNGIVSPESIQSAGDAHTKFTAQADYERMIRARDGQTDGAESDRVARDFALQQVLSRVRSRELDSKEDDESEDSSPANPFVQNAVTKARDLPPVEPTAAIVASHTL